APVFVPRSQLSCAWTFPEPDPQVDPASQNVAEGPRRCSDDDVVGQPGLLFQERRGFAAHSWVELHRHEQVLRNKKTK
ncbi:MAG: hypothetical protein ACK55I_33225, partial [bacterium]